MIVVNLCDAFELLTQGRCERVSGQLMEVSHASLGRYCIVNLVHGLENPNIWFGGIYIECCCKLKPSLTQKLCMLCGLCRFVEFVKVT